MSKTILREVAEPILRLLLPEQNIQRPKSAVALTRGDVGDDVLAEVSCEPFDDRLFQPRALDGAQPATVDDLHAEQPFFECVLHKIIKLRFRLRDRAAVKIERGLNGEAAFMQVQDDDVVICGIDPLDILLRVRQVYRPLSRDDLVEDHERFAFRISIAGAQWAAPGVRS